MSFRFFEVSLLCFIVLTFCMGCQHEQKFVIDGHVGNDQFNGEKIYLVPFKEPTQASVDSAVIEDGRFKFEKREADTSVFIIRPRPILRLKIEELLVVNEPGTLKVFLDESSRAVGTPLNDSLQNWKEEKMRRDRELARLRDKGVSDKEIDSLEEENIRFYFKFVKRNFDNPVGQLVYNIMKEAFSEQQKKKLKNN